MPVINRFKNIMFILVRLIIPSLLTVILFLAFSFIGVFIEEDKYLLLIGGFEEFIIMLILFIFSNFLAWFISEFIFKYSVLLNSGLRIVTSFLLSWLLQITLFCIYYYIIFFVITGLRIDKVEIMLSEKFSNDLGIILFSLLIILTLINICAHIVLIHIKPELANDDHKKSSNDTKSVEKTKNSSNSSTFEDSISI